MLKKTRLNSANGRLFYTLYIIRGLTGETTEEPPPGALVKYSAPCPISRRVFFGKESSDGYPRGKKFDALSQPFIKEGK